MNWIDEPEEDRDLIEDGADLLGWSLFCGSLVVSAWVMWLIYKIWSL